MMVAVAGAVPQKWPILSTLLLLLFLANSRRMSPSLPCPSLRRFVIGNS